MNRVTAIQWARSRAYAQLTQVVRHEAHNWPMSWHWEVGRQLPRCTDIVVRATTADNVSAIRIASLLWGVHRMGEEARGLADDINAQLRAVARRHARG